MVNKRLDAMNCFPNHKYDTREIVYVGDTMKYLKVKGKVEKEEPIAIVGKSCSGKLTILLKAVEELKKDYVISYDGEDFGDEPYYTDLIYIIRNPINRKKMYEYWNDGLPVYPLYDDWRKCPDKFENIRVAQPSSHIKQMYKELKKKDMIVFNYVGEEEVTKNTLANLLKGKDLKVPLNAHLWYSHNFKNNDTIQRICEIAGQLRNEELYDILMKVIKLKGTRVLTYPPRLK